MIPWVHHFSPSPSLVISPTSGFLDFLDSAQVLLDPSRVSNNMEYDAVGKAAVTLAVFAPGSLSKLDEASKSANIHEADSPLLMSSTFVLVHVTYQLALCILPLPPILFIFDLLVLDEQYSPLHSHILIVAPDHNIG